MLVKSAPPEGQLEGRRLAVIAVPSRESGNAPQSVAQRSLADNTGRSAKYRTFYRLGWLGCHALYFHPLHRFAVEIDDRLVSTSDLSRVRWELSTEFLRDLDTNPALWEALPAELQQAVAEREEIEWAAECELEKRAIVIAANARLVYAELW